MKDQVDALVQRGIRATLINSTLDPAEQRARILEVEAGRYELVYVAPERFRSRRFVEAMGKVRPALLAVDEAHCISEWGHDFRPDYARIGHARRQLGSPACIALTATATDLVRRDIADQLDLRDPSLFVTGFDRPNLSLLGRLGRSRGRQARRRGPGARPQPRPGDHLRLDQEGVRDGRPAPAARAPPRGRRLPRRPDPRGAHPGPGAVHGGRGGRGRRHQRLRHGGGQGRYPLGDPLQPAGHPGGLLPGGRPRRPRRPARRVPTPVRLRRQQAPGDLHRERVPPHVDGLPRVRLPPRPGRRPDRDDAGRDPRGGRHRPPRVGRRHGAEDPRRGRGDREVPAPREHGDRPDQRRGGRARPGRPAQPAGARPADRPARPGGAGQPPLLRAGLLPPRRLRRRPGPRPPRAEPGFEGAGRRAAGRLRPAVPRQRRAGDRPLEAAARPVHRLRRAGEAQEARVRQARTDDQVCPVEPMPPRVHPGLLRRHRRGSPALRPVRQLRAVGRRLLGDDDRHPRRAGGHPEGRSPGSPAPRGGSARRPWRRCSRARARRRWTAGA